MIKFPYDELNGHDFAHVEWVKSQRDAGLWHVFAMALLVAGDPLGFLPWVFAQDETDRATAGYLFLGLSGNGYLQGQTEIGGEGLSDAQWLATMEAICTRAQSSGFSNNALGLAAGFEAERLICLDIVGAGKTVDGVTVPHTLLDTPFPAEQPLPYFVEEGIVLDYDPSA